MAVVDHAFREWIAAFKKANPSAAENRAIIDTAQYAFAAGREAQRNYYESGGKTVPACSIDFGYYKVYRRENSEESQHGP